jgi:hypothetical protein
MLDVEYLGIFGGKPMAKKSRKKSAAKAEKTSKKFAKKAPKKKVVAKRKKTGKAKGKAKRKGLGAKVSGAYRAVVDTFKGTDTLRNKLEQPGTSESE